MKFYVPCVPPKATAQQVSIMKRRDGTQFVGKKHGSNADKAQKSLFAMFYPFRPDEPLTGPLRLSIDFVWPWRSSESKRNRAIGYKFSEKRPDADNLAKMTTDCLMQSGFFADDSLVASLHVTKGWGGKHGIFIGIEQLDEEAVTATLFDHNENYNK